MTNDDVLREMKDLIQFIDNELVLKAYVFAIKSRLMSAQNIERIELAVSR